MSKAISSVSLIKVAHYDRVFYLIPRTGNTITTSEQREMLRYIRSIGDDAFLVSDELYFSEEALFHLDMKYCDKYNFI